MKELVEWYLKYVEKDKPDRDKEFRGKFNKATTNEEKAEQLLDGNHQWYLKFFHKSLRQELIAEIASKKCWEKSYEGGSFEDIYKDHAFLCAHKYVNQLTAYDVALRVAIVKDDPVRYPYPSEFVYLHATPMGAYRWLYKKGYMPVKVKGWNEVIPLADLRGVFHPLNARQIEDLLCHFEKGLKRLKEGKQSKGNDEPGKKLDKIVKKL